MSRVFASRPLYGQGVSPPSEPTAPTGDPALDDAVRADLARGDLDGAVTRIIRGLGPEVLGFMLALTHNPTVAGDAFSELSVDVWRSLPAFEWRATLRTWMYVLARRAVSRVQRGGPRAQLVPWSQVSAISRVAIDVRDASCARLELLHDRFAALRGQLDEEEQVILMLRVDRELGWRDIARVLTEDGADDDVDRVAATLRKRFERIKAKIRAASADQDT
jgi:DNA-directed RNA polymerase specialized sigma24 family protein